MMVVGSEGLVPVCFRKALVAMNVPLMLTS